jgi:hypothetical protein
MAKENIQIKIDAAVESAEAAKSLGQLKKALVEINELQAQLGTDSGPQFDQLASAATKASSQLAETRDRIGDISDRTRTLEGTPVERLSGSFGLLRESVMNLDFEKAKIGLEGLTNAFTPVVDGKLVTGFAGIKGAMSGLADGVKNLGTTFLQVGRALLTNPIFLLATAIALIVVGIIKLLDSLGLLKPMLDAIKAAIGFVIEMFQALTDWLGLTTHAQEKNAEAAKKNGETQRAEIDATAKKQQDHLKLIQGMTEDEIAEYQKKAGIRDNLNKNSFDIEKERLVATQETLKAEIDALNELEAAGGELTDEQKKDLEQRQKDYEANSDAIVLIEQQKQKAIIDINNKSAATLRDWQIKNIKDENERAKAQLKVTEADEIRKIDVAIAEAKRLGQSTKDLEASKLEVKKYFATQNEVIDQAINKKAVDAAKAASDKQSKLLQEQLKKKEDYWAVEIAKTQEGTQKRLDVEVKAENDLLKFKQDNAKKLGISAKQLELLQIQTLEKQKERQDAFNAGELANLDKTRIEKDKLAVLNAETDEQLYLAKRKLIQDQAEIDIRLAKDNSAEQQRISAEAYQAIEALDQEYNTKRLEDAAITSQLLVDKTNFEIEQYQRKYENIAGLDQKQIDNLIKLDMQEQVALMDQMALELADTELTEAQKNEIKERYRQLNIEQEQNAQERLRQAKLKAVQDDIDMAQKGLNAVSALTNALFENKRSNLKKGSAEEQKAAEQQFNINKGLQLGMAVIDGFKAVTSSLSQSPIAIGPVPNPAGIASLAFAIATSAANIIKIASTKFEKSPAPTTPSTTTPATPGGGAGEGGVPPMLQPNQFFGLGQTQPQGSEAPAQKVYVVESDITGTQERVRVIESRAVLS